RVTSATSSFRLPSIVLPDGDERDLWSVDGRLTSRPFAGAERLPGTCVLPGVFDAHAHLALRNGPLDLAGAQANLRALRGSGVMLVREVGAPASVPFDLRPEADDPALLLAGRWHAPEGRFYAPFYE